MLQWSLLLISYSWSKFSWLGLFLQKRLFKEVRDFGSDGLDWIRSSGAMFRVLPIYRLLQSNRNTEIFHKNLEQTRLVGYLLRCFQRNPILTKLHSIRLLEIIFYTVKLGQSRRWAGQHAYNTRNKHKVILDTTATFWEEVFLQKFLPSTNCLPLNLKRLLKSNLEELTERLALKQHPRVLN